MVKGVVFDFDGVIVRSIEQHADAYAAVLNPHGAHIERRDVLLREGARSETIIRDLMGDAGITPTDEQVAKWADEKQAVFREMGPVAVYPGVPELLEAVWTTGCKTAIVTGTRRANLLRLIPALADRFDAIVAQEDYSHDKPHPEPYLSAAKQIGVDLADCICVENAIRGIQSARAAGYGKVIGISTTLAAPDLVTAEPDVLVADHAALAAVLHNLLG